MYDLNKVLSTFLIMVSLVMFSGCSKKDEKKQVVVAPKPMEVKVHTLTKEKYPIWGEFSGKTEAVKKVIVKARVHGELLKQHFNPGDIVKKDQLLFSIDKSEYQAQWDQQNAILQKDKASLALALANVKRYRPLVKEQLAPREKLDELLATQKQFEAIVKSDEASLKKSQLNLQYCDVRANISGYIGREMVYLGNIINVGDELTQIVQVDYLYVTFNPTASDVAMLQKYKSEEKPKVRINLSKKKELNISLEGRIDFVDNVSNSTTGTVTVRAKILNKDKLLFPGSFVKIEVFMSDQYEVLAVHPDQVYQNQKGQFIYVVNDKNKIEEKTIDPYYSNNDMVLLPNEHEGDRVVVETIAGLRAGMDVVAVEAPNPVKR
ncbi:Probable RND efflux membrane fusion protein [hydrothermal vent metagenome]|uniref:Probable RND efflux membrane fusion protein n=1 Tax=hydrothermal vent metagenome TaxID=652676 RepID=A0A1W1EBW0_9ZZZZ